MLPEARAVTLKKIRKGMTFLAFGLAYLLALIAYERFLRKRGKKVVGFASDFFCGNIKYLHQEMTNCTGLKLHFVTGNEEELKRLRSSDVEAHYYMDINHIPLFLRTKVWITSHGPANIPFVGPMHTICTREGARPLRVLLRCFLSYWTKTRYSKWVDVWHGLAFKRTGREKLLDDYDVGFVTSTFFKRYYSKETGKSHKLKITGYPRTDPLVTKAWDRKKILQEIGVPPNRVNILYAPTHGHKWDKEFFPWRSMSDIIDRIEEFCERNKCNFMIRMHPLWYKQNAVSKEKLEERIAQTGHVFHLPSDRYVDVGPILSVSDVLITGWSSIANDFILLDKPIIFLEVELPVKEFVLKPEERAGFVVKGEREFLEKLEEALARPNLFEEERRILIKKMYDHLDGESSRRCAEEIMNLLNE